MHKIASTIVDKASRIELEISFNSYSNENDDSSVQSNKSKPIRKVIIQMRST